MTARHTRTSRPGKKHSPLPKPTEGELEILQVLWRSGPSSVADVLAQLPRKVGYTTVLKMLQIMFEKGLVRRDASTRRHTYEAALEQSKAQRRLVRDLLGGLFQGSASLLVQRALDAKPVSNAELLEIERLIADAKQERSRSSKRGDSSPVAAQERARGKEAEEKKA